MNKLLDKTKQAVSNVGDKMKLTAASRAPVESDNFQELVESVKKYQVQIHDLEEKLRGYVQAAGRLTHMMETLAHSADKVCYTSGLSASKDSIDVEPAKETVDGFKARVERVRSEISVIDEELKYALISHVEERNKAGAAFEKQRSKADKLESKNDPAASNARDEASRLSDNYRSAHASALSELEQWKSSAASRFEPVHSEVVNCIKLLFNTGGATASISSPSSSGVSSASSFAAAKSPTVAKTSSSLEPLDDGPPPDVFAPSPGQNKSAPPAATSAKAIGQWDFNAETPEEVSFRAGDVINLIEYEPDEEWWKGETPEGKIGLFPAAYVQKQ